MNKVECIGFINCDVPLEVKTPTIGDVFVTPINIYTPLRLRLDLFDSRNTRICTREYTLKELHLYNSTNFYRYINSIKMQRNNNTIHINKYTVPCINIEEVESMLDKLSINYDYTKTVVNAVAATIPTSDVHGLINVIEVLRGVIFSVEKGILKLTPLVEKEKYIRNILSYLTNIRMLYKRCLKELRAYRGEDMNDERDSIGECKEGRD